MARGFASLFSLLLLVAVAAAQAFGRFGYAEIPKVPGFEVGRGSFRTLVADSTRLRFEQPSARFQAVEVSPLRATYLLDGRAGQPAKFRVDLSAPGFELFFENGVRLSCTALDAPIVTWAEGSVGPEVPTPLSRWFVLTFSGGEPPVLLAFLDGPAALEVTGESGNWSIQTRELTRSWVRVALPMGIDPFVVQDTGDLGRLAARVRAHEPFWTQHAPQLVTRSTELTEDGLWARWTFDKPGAVVPVPVLRAQAGGYDLVSRGELLDLRAETDEGPTVLALSETLEVFFPSMRVPNGRGLTVGDLSTPSLAGFDPFVPGPIFGLAMENLLAARPADRMVLARGALEDYITRAPYVEEPHSGQMLPFAADGEGMLLAACYALVMQSLALVDREEASPNSLMTSVLWARDWHTWRIWGNETETAAAVLALAACLCPEPERRLEGAMLEAGLSSIRSRQLFDLRQAFYRRTEGATTKNPFLQALRSEVRVYSSEEVVVVRRGNDLFLRWTPQPGGELTFASAYPIRLEPATNLEVFEATEALGMTVVRYRPKGRGAVEAKLTRPAWAAPLPWSADVPNLP